jgi:hypothetical protein
MLGTVIVAQKIRDVNPYFRDLCHDKTFLAPCTKILTAAGQVHALRAKGRGLFWKKWLFTAGILW